MTESWEEALAAYVTHIIREGAVTLIVQRILGHESLRTTQIYTHVTVTDLGNTAREGAQAIDSRLRNKRI